VSLWSTWRLISSLVLEIILDNAGVALCSECSVDGVFCLEEMRRFGGLCASFAQRLLSHLNIIEIIPCRGPALSILSVRDKEDQHTIEPVSRYKIFQVRFKGLKIRSPFVIANPQFDMP